MGEKTLDNIYAHCTQLGDEDFKVLLAALKNEEELRNKRVKQAAWDRVVEALDFYTSKYGSIEINDYDKGDCIFLHEGEYKTHTIGEIEVE